MEDKITNSLKKIPKVEQGQKVVLGIDGLSRSGKTTLVRNIEQHIQEKNIFTCVLHIDDYIVERERRYNTGNEEWYEYYNLQWDVEWLKENLFKKLKESNELQLLTYDNSSDSQKLQTVRIPNTCLIIIEGVFLQREEWRNHFDFMIFLDCVRDERFNRESGETQTNIEKFEKRYWKAENHYLETVSPIEQSDLVIQN
ncbi:kinase [Virgibacillus litoralis]|uniref:Uridine kinase n=1 Tax=Virgibacillus litoralis TaxID=578221 RepID=A0ABS4HGD5_9BACI|nr:kinase [Virgibacillus litoralis]MBP1949903.1 uridine kinase [Virgibacillus litoralis]